jgi:hypothetical protein
MLAGLMLAAAARGDLAAMRSSFAQPPDDARIRVRWWWFGPAVTKPELEREMQAMKAGGIGGFEVQQTYPLAIDGSPPGLVNLRFLSPQYFDALKFTAAKAKELGLHMDLTLGSGWPYGGPMFPIGEAAGRVRIQAARVPGGQSSAPIPKLKDGESLFAAFADAPSADPAHAFKEVPIADGAAQLPASAASTRTVLFFISGHTGMKVKRPAFGAEGYVIDHLSADVVDHFIQSIAQPQVSACGENPPHSVFCDSLEVGGEDWTGDFLAEFQKRRGYDLRPLLPALATDIGPATLEIRHDWGKSLTELFNDNFAARLQKFAAANHSSFRIQAYGSPSAGEFSYLNADLPEGEGYQWHEYRASRYASSACHLLGVPVSSSETFTWLHSPIFRATPLDIKAEANQHFLQGINQLVCHGWPYTAAGVPDPGWSFYASAVFDEKNPWFIVMPEVSKYLQRISFMMRQGQPANDVLLYLANSDAWANFTPGRVSLTDGVGECLGPQVVGNILDAGFNLDFFDDGLLEARGKVDGGTLAFGDLRYKLVVLAGVNRIPPATMRKLEEFARGGGIVVATRRLPATAPGYLATPKDQKEIQQSSYRLFQAPQAPGLFVPDESNLAAALHSRLQPDVALTPPAPEVGFVHRRADGTEIYFLANTSNQAVKTTATFRVRGMSAEQWDPISGNVDPVVSNDAEDGESVAINLPAYSSALLVWTTGKSKASPPRAKTEAAATTLDLSTGWTVQFGEKAAPVTLDQLHSWTDDPSTKNFSGVATYRKTVSIPPDMLGHPVTLTFGDAQPIAAKSKGPGFAALLDPPIREAAIIYINNQKAGSLWAPPYAIEIGSLLKPGSNEIRIDVANLALNQLAASGFPNYPYDALVREYGNRFQPQDVQAIQPTTAGLLGPVRLISERSE